MGEDSGGASRDELGMLKSLREAGRKIYISIDLLYLKLS